MALSPSPIRVLTSGLGRRRLASGEGQKGEEDDEETRQACENLEEILAAEGGEDMVSNPPPPPPTGASVEGAADKEGHRKKKRKTKHHEEGTEERSEYQAKMPRVDEWEAELDADLDLYPEELETLLLPAFEESTSSSLSAPTFSPESKEHSGLDTLEEQIMKGHSTLVQWLLDPKDAVFLTREEQRMPQGSADSSPLEGTSHDFIYDPSTHPVESGDPSEPSGDAEMPSTSDAASDVQPLPSHSLLPRVSQPSQISQSGSLLEGSATSPGDAALRLFNQYHTTGTVNFGTLVNLLRPLELLLRKESHNQQDLQAIINHSKKVYEFAKQRLWRFCLQPKANKLVRVLVLRVLVVDALWRACNVVGSPMKKEQWWPKLMKTVFGDAGFWKAEFVQPTYHSFLLEEMVVIMEGYSGGKPPSGGQMARLIRKVFHKSTGIPNLRLSEWDLWRKGDKDS